MAIENIVEVILWTASAQVLSDLAARHFVFSQESYLRSVANFERAKARRDKLASSMPKTQVDIPAPTSAPAPTGKKGKKGTGGPSSDQRRLAKAEEELAQQSTEVAARHSVPGMLSSVLFLIIFRVLGAKHGGKVVAILPFEPFQIVRRLTARGLPEGSPAAACSILVIYMLVTQTVRVLMKQFFSVQPPAGAGATSFLDTSKAQKLMKSFGVEEDLKEARKMFS